MNKVNQLKYIIITPARNEEDFIENTIKSVISQTILPEKWVIVSDGSTDQTDEIVQRYAKEHNWIMFLRRPDHKGRDFASKVHSFYEGLISVKDVSYDIIGNLDADLTFSSGYFKYLLDRFSSDSMLGVAGTPFVEKGTQVYDYDYTNTAHVSGACQLFRRKCYDDIGGYIPIKGGGIDWVAVTTARLKGWHTQTFMGMTLSHHRKIGTGNSKKMISIFNHGRKDYRLGNHPIWQIFRSAYQMNSRPYCIKGFLLLAGYFYSQLIREERPISKELMLFARNEQLQRLKNRIFKIR